ncbi:hypothetical protein Tco_0713448 [Tanacetum coccineum]
MTGDSANDHIIKSPLSNILNKSVFIQSHTTIRPDGRVQSYCRLKLADIPASGTNLRQDTVSGSKYAHTRARRRSAGPSLIRAAKKTPKGAALTSAVGAKIDHSINTGRGPYTFRINGQNYHRMGSLLPAEGVQPRYAQLYFFDTQNEIRNRMFAFVDNESCKKVDENIVADLTQMLDHSNPIVRSFRMAKKWCHSNPSTEFGLRLLLIQKLDDP